MKIDRCALSLSVAIIIMLFVAGCASSTTSGSTTPLSNPISPTAYQTPTNVAQRVLTDTISAMGQVSSFSLDSDIFNTYQVTVVLKPANLSAGG